jgi:endonuclease/exonuclease/phosphatase family metal-dependent hydrolase
VAVAFPKPRTSYDYDLARERKALRDYPRQLGKEDRAIPAKKQDRLLLATWNIANLGVQERREKDYKLIAEILGWFDLVAIQETNDELKGLREIQKQLPSKYKVLFSDPGGNDERYVFLYDSEKVTPLEEVGEATIPPSDLDSIKLPGVTTGFAGFDRNPYVAGFTVGGLTFSLANCHLFFGKGTIGIDRRCLEAYGVAWWADKRRRDKSAYTPHVVALGDFNLPAGEPSDRVFAALTRKGFELPEHQTTVPGSNLGGTEQYDQMAVFPGPMRDAVSRMGIFDFDGAVFKELWGNGTKAEEKTFEGYVKYYLSDHRPLWAEVRV